MKQKLLKMTLLLCALVVGSTSVWAETKTDVLNRALTGVTGTSYAEWSGKTANSSAVYAGQSAGGNESIQLRSNNNNSGVVTTTSGGKVKSVTVVWDSNTADGRTLNVYGKSTAYSAATDLYGDNAGTLLGTIVYGTSTELNITDDYEYIGFRSASGAMYLTSVSIVWETGGGSSAVATTTTIDATGITNTDVYVNTVAGSLSATVKDNNNTAINGAIVTWSGSNDEVATIDENGAVTLVAAGSVTFTASYAGETGTYQASYGTYEMTVTSSAPYVQPTTIEITPNYTFWGKTAQFSGNENDNLSGSKDNVSLDWNRGSGSTYANTNAMRFYKDNSLTFTAPTGYEIKSIVIDGSLQNDLTFSPTGFDSETKTWAGASQTVTMSRPSSGSSYATISKYTITIGLSSTDPYISADDVELTYDKENGSISYTISNEPIPAGTLSADIVSGGTITNLIIGTITGSEVPFTCDANNTTSDRTSTVTLTYTYGNNETVTKDVTITQAAAPVIYTTIPDLFAAANTTATEVYVTFNNWVVSGVSTNGKNVFVTDNAGNGFVIYSSSDQSSTYAVGNVLLGTAVPCKLVLYNGFAEITNLDASNLTINSGGTVTAANIDLANLAGVNTGALVSYENLTCNIDNNKYYLSDGTTTLQVFNSLFAFEALTSGKAYNITGIYQQYNSTKEILPRSAADIEEMVVITPSITVDPATVNVPDVAVTPGDLIEGTLNITYENLTINEMTDFDIQYYDAENNELTNGPSWIDVVVAEDNGDYVVSYVLVDNDGATRSTYLKVYALDDETNIVYSNLVTITQAGVVVDYATLPFEFNSGKSAIETTNGLTQNGLGTDYNSNTAPTTQLKFDGTGDYLILKINEEPSILCFDIKGNSFSGGTFTVQASLDGETYTDLKIYSKLDATQTESFSLTADTRYIKWIYTEKTSGNVGLGNIKMTKPVVKLNAKGFATYSSVNAIDFSEATGYTAWYVKSISGETITFEKITGAVAGNTGVLLMGDENGEANITFVASGTDISSTNKLTGITTATAVEDEAYYGLSGNTFVKVNEGTVPAGKALLPASEVSASVKAYNFVFEDDPDGIKTIDNGQLTMDNAAIYNLAGQRIDNSQFTIHNSQLKRGIYIVNGKKILK